MKAATFAAVMFVLAVFVSFTGVAAPLSTGPPIGSLVNQHDEVLTSHQPITEYQFMVSPGKCEVIDAEQFAGSPPSKVSWRDRPLLNFYNSGISMPTPAHLKVALTWT